ncbi:hypothetical protein OCUBac02_42640 [Bosea sp. ANAM02]|nr:hypothetical protein OCUBac02_42640 [Bosea sp. ANAM02]
MLFRELGMTHESNYFLPPSAGDDIPPWIDFTGIVQVPIRWEDDVHLLDPTIGEPVAHLGKITPLTVDFHPIHLFLNTTSIAEYEHSRPIAQDPVVLRERRRAPGSGGSRDHFLNLLEAAQQGAASACMRQLRPNQEN